MADDYGVQDYTFQIVNKTNNAWLHLALFYHFPFTMPNLAIYHITYTSP